MSNSNKIEVAVEKQTLSRKQFLTTIGIAAIGFLIPSVFFTTKKKDLSDASYGNNSYGGKA